MKTQLLYNVCHVVVKTQFRQALDTTNTESRSSLAHKTTLYVLVISAGFPAGTCLADMSHEGHAGHAIRYNSETKSAPVGVSYGRPWIDQWRPGLGTVQSTKGMNAWPYRTAHTVIIMASAATLSVAVKPYSTTLAW